MTLRTLFRGRFVLATVFLAVLSAFLWANPLPRKVQGTVTVPSLDAHRALARRVSHLEILVEKLLAAQVEPPVVVEPPVTGAWPASPSVSLLYDSREDDPITRAVRPGTWEARAGRRFSKVGNTIDDTQFIVWFEQTRGIDATRVTIAAINGLSGVGPTYFEQYQMSVNGVVIDNIRGKHIIPPRYAIFRRMSVGPEAAVLRDWTYTPTDPALPSWVASQTARDTAKRIAFPPTTQGGVPVNIGPYNFFWHGHSLSDSHGGQGVAPFHGGPDDWLVLPEGKKNREAEMLLDFQRSIWFLDANYEPFEPFHPYWMGRTNEHEPPGYQYTVDNWCPYASTLITYEFADGSHLSRGTAGAAALAPYDIVGEDCLNMVFSDFKTAHSLDPEHPGKDQGNFLLFPLWKKIEVANGPSGSGDRTLAHKLRLLRWCRPYFETEPYDEAMRVWVNKLSDQYGMTNAGSPGWTANPNVMTVPLVPPTNYVFHQQLVTYEMLRFGGLDDLGKRGVNFLTSRPPSAYEMRSGSARATVLDFHHTATAEQEDPKWSYLAYTHFTHDILVTHGTPTAFLGAMRGRGINGSSQDLDCTPRSLWAAAPR